MTTPVTAVFDIGKTNKKFLLFDNSYSLIQKQQTTLDQVEDEDGDPCEDLELLERWIHNKLNNTSKDKSVKIKALNFSAYGASLVHLDKNGEILPPFYNYLKSYPQSLLTKLYEDYGGKETFALQTASPPMGMLNSGLQLYWLKNKKPLKFKEIKHSLHFPQYLSYLITGKFTAEQTSVGCHTGLWDYKKGDYHQWLRKENLVNLLPSVQPVSTTFDTHYNGDEFRTGIGIHDSSAALAPYLFLLGEPFMLASTGTWSITLNPFNKEPLTFEELQKDCLCYLDVQGNQVKASRFFLGEEYMHQVEKISDAFGVKHYEEAVDLDNNIIRRLVNDQSLPKLELSAAYNSGPYPMDKPGVWQIEHFSSYKEAYHQLMLDLVSIQVKSIQLAHGSKQVDHLIISGGFSQNDFFVSLLASFLPNKKVYTASLPHASALGAAMVVNDVKNFKGKSRFKDLLGLKQHRPIKGLGVENYLWKESTGSYKI